MSFVDISDIENKINQIAQKYNPEKIILFGSYAEGIPTPDSDVDLLVIMDTQKSTWDVAVEVSLMLNHTFPMDIMDIIVKTPQYISHRLHLGDFFIRDIMEKGKVFYERVG